MPVPALEGADMTREYTKRTVYLSDEERQVLKDYVTKGSHPAMIIRRAKVILDVDRNGEHPKNNADAARDNGLSTSAVINIKTAFIEAESLDEFLQRKKRETPPVPPKITGDVEARIIALSCGEPPPGYQRWTLKLLAEKAVELGYIDSISDRSVCTILKKTR